MELTTFTITSDGKDIPQTIQVLSIDIVREVNRIPYAELRLSDGDAAQREFPVSDSGIFDPGKKIVIKLGSGVSGEQTEVFNGIVVAQSVRSEKEISTLTVELKEAVAKLAQVRKSRVFSKKSDDQLVRELADAQGIKVDTLAATQPVHEEIVQYACSDWDFIVTRAEANGLLVCAEPGSLALKKIEAAGKANKTLEYGMDPIYAIELDACAEGQYGEVSSLAWDAKNQKMSAAKKAKDATLAPGDLAGKTLAEAMGAAAYAMANPAAATPEELQSWADATLNRSRLALVRGHVSLEGFAGLKLLDAVEIKGVGKHFNGKALVTGWHHRVGEDGWVTELRLGLAADWFSARNDVAALPAAGLLPPVGGLQIGVVSGFEEDPNKEFRVKVSFPALGQDQPALWARLATPDAGSGRGFFFRPEKGDEVVLGFLNDDPRQPVIVGALYGSVQKPPQGFETLSEKNALKGIVTKAGTRIAFDDKNQGKAAVTIETAGKNKIRLDDDAKSITLEDQHGNRITLDKDGITLKSAKDFKLEASGKVEIKGSSVDVK